MRSTRRGLALILVLGMLALLALLAVSFATLAAGEREIAHNYSDAVRARLAADSGIEAALALLQRRVEEGAIWSDRSWSVAAPGSRRVDGEEIRDAGVLGAGRYAPDGELYRVRIEDAHAKLHVNDGLLSEAVARNLARILNLLGAQPGVDVPGLGDRILAARPPGGYASLFDVARAVGREAFERARPFLTVHAWSDPDVCQPVPLSAETARLHAVQVLRPASGGGSVFRYGHQKNFLGERVRAPLLCYDPANPDPGHHRVWGRDSLNPQWIEIVSRSPVNINTARREVLIALLTDLEGVFLVERRRGLRGDPRAGASPCASPGGAYDWTALRYRNDEGDESGGECGLLYRTLPFTGPGGRSRSGIPAAAVAGEIVACRERKASPSLAGLDYASAPFGGPFGSWSQFHRFVDALVERGLLADPREEQYWDLDAAGRRLPGSAAQLRAASQAIGDVLKANFNPNLHLNELNPDRALFQLVDKTDLIVASTEFCLTPMGIFDLDSQGLVTRPLGGDGLETVARARSVVSVKLFDARRETSQAQFYRGEATPRKGGAETNNNRGVEIGPEPDNGLAPSEGACEGYLQLSTLGSNFSKTELKPAGELWTTLSDPSFYPGAKTMAPGGAHLGSSLHAHFQFDHAAHHSGSRNASTWPRYWDGFRLPQGAWQSVFGRRGALNRNWEDRTETLPSPYSPVDAARAGQPGRYRLARSFAGAAPEAVETAPSDLRLDGAYVERDSAFGYWIDENVSFNFNEGTAAFWVKPAFTPESTSKRRTLLSLGRYHAALPQFQNPSPFGLFFLPPHDGDDSTPPSYAGGILKFPSCGLAFGFGFSSATGYSWEMGGKDAEPDRATSHAFVFSPSLPARNVFRPHEWTHVAVAWDNPRNQLPNADTVRLYVNGRILKDTLGLAHRFDQEGQPFRNTPWWTVHSLQAVFAAGKDPGWVKNTLRLGGEPSRLFELPGQAAAFPGNYTADATLDEFYLWMDRGSWYGGGLWGLQQLWNRGRYYRPNDQDPEDARFTSGAIRFAPLGLRAPAPPAARRRLLGLSWTEFAEDYDDRGRPRMLDWSRTPPAPLRPESGDSIAELGVEAEGAFFGPFRSPAFSAVLDASGHPLEIPEAAELRYTVKLRRGGAGSPILLASPVVDDVTLYFDAGTPRILAWVRS